jgi:hypothetical protein
MPAVPCGSARKKDENVYFLTIARSFLLCRILSQLGLLPGLKQTANAMAMRMMLLHAREYPSGSTPNKSKLNMEPNTAIIKAITDKATRAFKIWDMVNLLSFKRHSGLYANYHIWFS